MEEKYKEEDEYEYEYEVEYYDDDNDDNIDTKIKLNDKDDNNNFINNMIQNINIENDKSCEWLAIYTSIKQIMKNLQNEVNIVWKYDDVEEYRKCIIYGKEYEMNILFSDKNRLISHPWFEYPPTIHVNSNYLMNSKIYFICNYYPLLSIKYWNPCHNLGNIVKEIIDLMNMYVYESLPTPEKEEMEIIKIIEILYERNQFNINYEKNRINKIIDSAIQKCEKQYYEKTSSDFTYIGTGYSTACITNQNMVIATNTNTNTNTDYNLYNKLFIYFSKYNIKEHGIYVSWFQDSPLLSIIISNIESMNIEEIYAYTNDLFIWFQLLHVLDIKMNITNHNEIEICYKNLANYIHILCEHNIQWKHWYEEILLKESIIYNNVKNNVAQINNMIPTWNTIIKMDNIHDYHYFINKENSSKLSTCYLKEIKLLSNTKLDDIQLFISDSKPAYLISFLYVSNIESPYYGGLYEFHIFIPDDYPNVPPKVQYMTTNNGTVRFNPNLYKNGRVCLSLLGTWSGEAWNPSSSNLIQVLKSILYLIFTEEPYYNEPGYTRTKENKESKLYNTNLYPMVIQYAMLNYWNKEMMNRVIIGEWCIMYLKKKWNEETIKILLRDELKHDESYVQLINQIENLINEN